MLEIGFQLLLLPTYILPHSAEIRKVIIHVPFVRCCCYCIFTLTVALLQLKIKQLPFALPAKQLTDAFGLQCCVV